jgi:hypothetical protein
MKKNISSMGMSFLSSKPWTGQSIERHFPNSAGLVCDIGSLLLFVRSKEQFFFDLFALFSSREFEEISVEKLLEREPLKIQGDYNKGEEKVQGPFLTQKLAQKRTLRIKNRGYKLLFS